MDIWVRYMIYKYFTPFCWLSLIFSVVFFEAQNILILMKFSLSDFSFVAYIFFVAFGIIPKNPLLNPRSQRFTSIFSPKSFVVLTRRSLMHLKLILCGVRQGSNFTFLHVDSQLCQYHLLKRLFFPH